MLKQRVQTALVIAPLLVLAVILLPTTWFAVLLMVVVGAGAWELAPLGGYRMHPVVKGIFAAFAVLLAVGLLTTGPAQIFIWLGLAAWFAAMMWLINPEAVIPGWIRLGVGLMILLTGWTSLVLLHGEGESGHWLVLLLLALVVAADIGAYFAGRQFGKRKLAPRISPGKTWAGVTGGLLAAVPVALVGAFLLGVEAYFGFVVVCLLAVMASVFGDLVESLLKRQAGVKDSGSLLPGHGGVLDRLDSVVAAAPIFLILVVGAVEL